MGAHECTKKVKLLRTFLCAGVRLKIAHKIRAYRWMETRLKGLGNTFTSVKILRYCPPEQVNS